MNTKMTKFLMAALLALGASGVWAGVAKIGDVEYDSIDEAVANWTSGTLTLLADVKLTKSIVVTGTQTLDLSTYTMTADSFHAIKVEGTGSASLTVKADATNPGGIKTASTSYSAIYANYNDAKVQKTITINGGVFSSPLTFNKNSSGNSGEKPTPTAVTINGGYFKSTITAYRCYYLTINGGTFDTFSGSTAYQTTTCKSFYKGGRYKKPLSTTSAGAGKMFLGSQNADWTSVQNTDYYYIDADGYYVLTAGPSSLPKDYAAMVSGYRYMDAGAAIKKGGTVVLNVSSTENASVSSGTLTIDATAEGASYNGNVTLGKASSYSYGTFVLKVKSGDAYTGSVVAASGRQLHVTRTEANGVVTYTYTSATPVTEANAAFAIGSTYYSSVDDAFSAIDGTVGNVIVMKKDQSAAALWTNGGTTDVTFDLNGKSFTLGSLKIPEGTDYKLTIIDSSAEKSGCVTNTRESFMAIGLLGYITGNIDSTGRYTLNIKGGTWMFDPSSFPVGEETYNFVADGFRAVENDDGTWAVEKFCPEVSVAIPDEISVKDVEGNQVSVEAQTAAGNIAEQVKQDIVSNTILSEHTGTGVTRIENTSAIVAALQTQADAFEGRAQVTEESSINKYVNVEVQEAKVKVSGETATFASIVFDVTPKAEITIVSAADGSAGEEKTLTATIPNSDITEPITFRLPLPNYFTVSAIVKHAGDPDRLLPVKGETNGKYVEVTATHFSEFEVEPSDVVSTTVGSTTVLGIKRRADVAAGTVAVSVPWLGTDGNAIAVQDLIAKDCLVANDELHVWNGATYEAWKWSGTAWEAFESTSGAMPKKMALVRGQAAWLKRAAAGSVIQIGRYDEGAITTRPEAGAGTFRMKHSLLINPKSEATPLSKIAGQNGDQLVILLSSGKVRLECVDGKWGTVRNEFNPATFVTEKKFTEYAADIPADTGFWYLSAGGAPVIAW